MKEERKNIEEEPIHKEIYEYLLDFDGDTIAIQLVPEEVAEDVYNKMSPRYVNRKYILGSAVLRILPLNRFGNVKTR